VVPEHRIRDEQADGEVERLRIAFAETRAKLEEIRRSMQSTGLVGTIFDAQFLFLEDPTLRQHAESNVREHGLNAEWALQRELRRLEELFESMPDPYLRERASDIGFVVRRVLQALMGREPEGLRNAPAGVVVVAEDLSPGEVAQVTRDSVAAFVTETGSRTSHVTIMARSLEIPAVVGAGSELARELADGVTLIVDGRTGRVIVDPDPSTIAEYLKLLANVDQLEEARDALRYGAEGIGLYRTEFLFLNRHDLPGEEEQREAYARILAAVAPYSATIRTLDIGGEKVPTGLDLSDEANPALGLRGVRMSHHRPDVFRTQLRALLRASANGKLKILLPMVSSLAEVEFARAELEDAKRDLARERVAFDRDTPLGVMIETPAAAMIVDLIAPLADFLSIGTNDLLQYTLAVDRSNEQVAYLYEPLHPAHLRMIQRIGQAARRTGIVVGMCGEMAGDPLHSWILVALGIGELSMAPFAIPLLKRILRDSTAAEARELLSEVLKLGGAQEIRERVERRMRARFPVEFERIALQG
jgi:phosphotransferase system enzyme I (PtsI)